MSNPNTVTVWSPDGDGPFEMSKANARDLLTHRNWTTSPPGTAPAEPTSETVATTSPADETKEPADGSTDSSGSVEDASAETQSSDGSSQAEVGESSEGQAEEGEVTGLLTKVEHFVDMERDAVVAYLAKHFPDFKPHHLQKVETLVDKAVELANVENA